MASQRISEILKNPFNCGIISHNLLEGQVIEGIHEKMVTKELFLRANAVKLGNQGGYKVMIPNNDIPLKHFLKCENCGKYLRGYKAKKNQQYYYKCGTIGCACNKCSEKLHEQFKSKLDEYIVNIDEAKLPILKNAMLEIFKKNNASTTDSKTTFLSQLKEFNKKLERYEERFINEEMSRDIFEKFHKKLKLEKKRNKSTFSQTRNKCVEP